MESEGESGGKSLKNLGGQVCQICGDNVGVTAGGEPFIACDVCAFPVCRPCYEYERKDGNQSCPQCKTRYKRHKGLFKTVKHYLSIYMFIYVVVWQITCISVPVLVIYLFVFKL
ncbi:hypothetical protein CsSME_00011720 [Camellia sinensis var. sinensis]